MKKIESVQEFLDAMQLIINTYNRLLDNYAESAAETTKSMGLNPKCKPAELLEMNQSFLAKTAAMHDFRYFLNNMDKRDEEKLHEILLNFSCVADLVLEETTISCYKCPQRATKAKLFLPMKSVENSPISPYIPCCKGHSNGE